MRSRSRRKRGGRGQAVKFYNKYINDPRYTKLVPLKSGSGNAIRIKVGGQMGVYTTAGKILTFHP